MHLILTGATGLVGSGVLQHMLTTPTISQISILSRRPVPQAAGHAKARVILHHDFASYPSAVLAQLAGAEGCVWALGISATLVSKEEYERVTYEYPLAAARAFSTLASPSKPVKFIYVSGEGATVSPGRFTPYFGVVKGRAEAALLALAKDPACANLRVFSLRPAGVDPTYHPEIQQWIPQRKGMMGVVEQVLRPVLRGVASGMVSPTKELSRVLTDLAMGDGEPLEGTGVREEGRTVTNAGMRRLAGI